MPTQVWSLKIQVNTINSQKFELYLRKNESIHLCQHYQRAFSHTHSCLKFQNSNQHYQRSKIRAISQKKWIHSPLSTLSTIIFRCPLKCAFSNFESTLSTVQNSRYISGKSTPITSVNTINKNFHGPQGHLQVASYVYVCVCMSPLWNELTASS